MSLAHPFKVIVVSILLALAGTGTASAQTSFTDDPVGDNAHSPNAKNVTSSAFFDIVRAEVSKDAGSFTMTMRLSGPVPEMPPNPPGDNGSAFIWLFALDTVPNQSINGFPFAPGPGQSRPFEYFVLLSWDGGEFTTVLFDRTPLLIGGEVEPQTIPGVINPATHDELTFTVAPALIGNPSSFKWRAATVVREAHSGTSAVQAIDGTDETNWP